MKKRLLILGASGHGKVVADIALRMKLWETIEFLDDDLSKKNNLGVEVIGILKDIYKYVDSCDLFVAIGNSSIREKLINELIEHEATIPTLIHPNAIINRDVTIGFGTVLMAGTIINSSTIIGMGCIINTGAIVEHDNQLEDFVHISPGSTIAGSVHIGKRTWLGVGCTIINNVCVAADVKVAAGAVVVKSITKEGTYIGVPARRV